MSYLDVFGVLAVVGVDVSKFFRAGAGAGVLKHGAGVELESEKCDSAHLWWERRSHTFFDVGTRSHTFLHWKRYLKMWDLNDYIKTWLQSHRCASNTHIRTASQNSTLKQEDPM